MAELYSINSDLDRFDRQILKLLSSEGRLTITELAQRIGLSKTPCQVRVKRLREEGYILGFRAILDPQKLGVEHVSFTEVKLSDTREEALEAFNKEVTKIPEVEQCHMIAGPFDYLLKVRTTDMKAYRKVLGEQISSLPNVANTSTYVSMQPIKENSPSQIGE